MRFSAPLYAATMGIRTRCRATDRESLPIGTPAPRAVTKGAHHPDRLVLTVGMQRRHEGNRIEGSTGVAPMATPYPATRNRIDERLPRPEPIPVRTTTRRRLPPTPTTDVQPMRFTQRHRWEHTFDYPSIAYPRPPDRLRVTRPPYLSLVHHDGTLAVLLPGLRAIPGAVESHFDNQLTGASSQVARTFPSSLRPAEGTIIFPGQTASG